MDSAGLSASPLPLAVPLELAALLELSLLPEAPPAVDVVLELEPPPVLDAELVFVALAELPVAPEDPKPLEVPWAVELVPEEPRLVVVWDVAITGVLLPPKVPSLPPMV